MGWFDKLLSDRISGGQNNSRQEDLPPLLLNSSDGDAGDFASNQEVAKEQLTNIPDLGPFVMSGYS